MSNKGKSEFSVTGIFRHDLSGIDLSTSKRVDSFALARGIGIDEKHTVKAKITIEVVKEPCEFCRTPATGYQICQKCGKAVCDKCAKTDSGERYCPTCFDQMKSLSKLV
jgi:hypothetical protein